MAARRIAVEAHFGVGARHYRRLMALEEGPRHVNRGSRSCVKIDSRRCADLGGLLRAGFTDSGMVVRMVRFPIPRQSAPFRRLSPSFGPLFRLTAISDCFNRGHGRWCPDSRTWRDLPVGCTGPC